MSPPEAASSFVPTLHIVIPFYNELNTLQTCVGRIQKAPLSQGWSAMIVLVDDHSDDHNRRAADAVVDHLRADGQPFTLLRHERNRGKGAALQTGFDAILAAGGAEDDLVLIQDADLEYDPADYHRLLQPLLEGTADVVVGSRFAGTRARGLKHAVHRGANRMLTLLSNLMTGWRLADMECCYKVMSVGTLRRLRPWLSEPRYGVEPEMIAALSRLGARPAQVAVSYAPRSSAEGKKIRWTDGVRAIFVIVRERFRRRPAGAGGA